MNLVNLADLTADDISTIWRFAAQPPATLKGTVAWSFEGNGIRTRTTFIRAFRELGLEFTELPNLLKTQERVRDLAGYLDPHYDTYVVRESNHQRLAEFAAASRRPVINAMSSEGHPCEVLTDAYYIDTTLVALEQAKICLWGPPTNIFRSWHELARVFNVTVSHVCDPRFHEPKQNVAFLQAPPASADIVITDGWPSAAGEGGWALTRQHLAEMGQPRLLPTPSFTIGRELGFDPLEYAGFSGYDQKELLVPVQQAILRFALGGGTTQQTMTRDPRP